MKLGARVVPLLVWVAVAGCGGADHAPVLGDYSGDEPNGLPSDTDTDTDTGTGGSTSSTGNAGSNGNGGSSGTYIPTPDEGQGGAAGTDPDPGMMAASGAGGAGGSSGTVIDPCARGSWSGDFTAYSQSDLQALSGYTHVPGQLYIGTSSDTTATDVRSLAPLACLQTVDGSFTILESPLLTDLQGLEHLEQVDNLKISFNAGLLSLQGPTALVVLETLLVRNNPALAALTDGIVGAGSLYIDSNVSLPECSAEQLAASLGVPCGCSDNNGSGSCN